MVENIDPKDKKILSLLDFNARLPLTALAQATGLTKQTADYRIKSLLKRGIIEGFFPVINTPRLGYKYCRIFVQFDSLDAKTEKRFIEYIFQNEKMFWAFSLGGDYDYLLVYWVETLTEFEKIIRGFEARFGNTIRKKSEQVITNVIHLSHKIFDPNRIHRFDLKETSQRTELDKLDKAILHQLCIDSRQSLVEIAEKTKTSPKVVSYRINRMENEEFLVGFRPIVSYEKLGLTYYKVFFNLSFDNTNELPAFEEFLLNHPKTLFIVKGIGMESDLDVELLAESNQAFFDFIQEAKQKFPHLIRDYKYLIYTKTIKVNYLPFI
jgi:Lrp/AsnC family leucine-responsive transcriptional regulator